MRVAKEVPLPRTGETRADRLERGRDRLYRVTGMDARREVNRFLSLDFRSDDKFPIACVLALTSRPPRKRKKKAG